MKNLVRGVDYGCGFGELMVVANPQEDAFDE